MSKKKYKKTTKYVIGKTTEELTGTKIKYGSATYSLLCFAAMKSRMTEPSFSIREAMHVLAGKLTRASDTQKAINILINYGCLEKSSDNRWKLTDFGMKTRKIFGWYGNTVSNFEMEKNKNRAASQKRQIGWEDQIEISF